jgi:hypothetical protein
MSSPNQTCIRCCESGHDYSSHKCLYCNSLDHNSETHLCCSCGKKGHGTSKLYTDNQIRIYCNESTHTKDYHKCNICNENGHEVLFICKKCYHADCDYKKLEYCPIIEICKDCISKHPRLFCDDVKERGIQCKYNL